MINSVGTTIRKINSSNFENAYFLKGNDYFLQNFFIKSINKKFNEEVSPHYLNLEEEEDLKYFLNSSSSNSLFSSKNIYVIRNFSKVKSKNKEEILYSLNIKNDDSISIFVVDDFYAKNKFFNELSKYAIQVDARTPFPNKIKEWVNYALNKKGITVDPYYLNKMIASYGDDISNILSEIDKIYLYTKENHIKLDNQFVSEYANRGIRPWNLVDAIGNKDIKKSCRLFHILLINGFTATAIIINFTNLFKELLLSNNNVSSNEYNGLNKIINNNIKKYSKIYSKNELNNLIINLRNIDYLYKTSTINYEYLILIFIIRVCNNYYK